mmetsp:Transcript_5331/g.17293  ORF Transcript_5331/g.17293 Transcript_5331/m.17293 type:complete len:139 (+) Transcript_5331:1443-1859(+)
MPARLETVRSTCGASHAPLRVEGMRSRVSAAQARKRRNQALQPRGIANEALEQEAEEPAVLVVPKPRAVELLQYADGLGHALRAGTVGEEVARVPVLSVRYQGGLWWRRTSSQGALRRCEGSHARDLELQALWLIPAR